MFRFVCVSAAIFADLFFKITDQNLDIFGYRTEITPIRTYPNVAIKFLLFLLPQYDQQNNSKIKDDGIKAKKNKTLR